MKIKILFLASVFVIGGLFLASNVFAQEASEDVVIASNIEEDIAADEDITAKDLGVFDPKILPDRPLYVLKNLWQELRVAFAFTKVQKAELRLHYANLRLIEAKKMAEKPGKEEILQRVLAKYQEEIEKLKAQIEKLEEKAADNPKIDKFLDKYTDRVVKQQRLMDRLEKKLSDKPEVLEKIREAKEQSLEQFGEVMNKLEEKDKIPERLEKNLDKVEGSQYKNFKNLEVLLELENKVPEQAKEAIQQAQQNALKRLHGDLNNMSPEDQAKFKDYLEKVSGDENTKVEIIEKLQQKVENQALPSALNQKLNQVKQRVNEKIQTYKRNCKNLCGDGKCQEIVCMAIGCPCAETIATCPQDCLENPNSEPINETCAREGEKVNRNPLLGSTDRKCCPGLKEERVSKSYSICRKGIECGVSITCEPGYATSNTGEVDSQGCPIMECVPLVNPNSEPIPQDELENPNSEPIPQDELENPNSEPIPKDELNK